MGAETSISAFAMALLAAANPLPPCALFSGSQVGAPRRVRIIKCSMYRVPCRALVDQMFVRRSADLENDLWMVLIFDHGIFTDVELPNWAGAQPAQAGHLNCRHDSSHASLCRGEDRLIPTHAVSRRRSGCCSC